MVDSITGIGLAGLQAASQRIAEVAQRISDPASSSSPDVEDFVELKVQERAFQASAAVIKVGEDLKDSILNILA